MKQAIYTRDHRAFLARLATAAALRYERREAPELADVIAKIAEGFEEHKQTVRELQQRVERAETRAARPGAGAFTGSQLETKGSEPDVKPPTPEERKAFSEMLRTGNRGLAPEARANVNAGTSGQGLEAVAPWFDTIVRNLARDAAPLLKIVGRQKVGNFPARHIVTNATVMGFGWTGEQGNRADTEPPAPLVVEVQAGEWYALPEVTEWALTDIAFDAENWLRRELVFKYAESMQQAIVGGNGAGKPTGFLAGPTPVATADGARAFGTLQYYPTGQAAALPATTSGVIDLLLDLVHNLQWAYRQNASWTMSALTMSALRKYKDADGRPILLDSMITGVPATLLGYPVIECEAMPPIGANGFPIAFGDFESGYIVDEDTNSIKITRDDITRKGFVKFYARQRVGGKILDSRAIKLLKVATS